ncbi:MAG: PHP domain-containing protein [Thermodesulfovibrionia bacterium]|nr:PHP domain-containing protein [Thermodesulfovibrionia bacterium]
MLKQFKADLHIHTCLSPCADLTMTPSAIVKTAAERGLDIVAITDHNSAENVIASQKSAENSELAVLAGMEITSAEEAHILAIFDDVESVIKLQKVIYDNLMHFNDNTTRFNDQIVVNEKDEVLGFNNRFLIAATMLDTYSIVNTIHSLGGLSIASHVDREAFGIISQLGFIPEDLQLDALEMSPGTDKKTAENLFKNYRSFPWISSSDAHYLKDINRRNTRFYVKEPSVTEISYALKNTGGRKVEWE